MTVAYCTFRAGGGKQEPAAGNTKGRFSPDVGSWGGVKFVGVRPDGQAGGIRFGSILTVGLRRHRLLTCNIGALISCVRILELLPQ